jgi:hypothetical protein
VVEGWGRCIGRTSDNFSEGCSRSDRERGGRDAVGVESGDSEGDGPFRRVARSVALLLIGLTVLRSKDADVDVLVWGVGEV